MNNLQLKIAGAPAAAVAAAAEIFLIDVSIYQRLDYQILYNLMDFQTFLYINEINEF